MGGPAGAPPMSQARTNVSVRVLRMDRGFRLLDLRAPFRSSDKRGRAPGEAWGRRKRNLGMNKTFRRNPAGVNPARPRLATSRKRVWRGPGVTLYPVGAG